MKRILTCLVLLLATFVAQAQNYIPFPTSNTMWTQREGNGDTTPSYYCYALTAGDTTFNILTYHKLFRSQDTIFTAAECIGGLREDSMKRVFFHSFSTGQERLLYDFAVQPGDTVDNNPGSAGIVDYIDSINILGIYHRRINFKTYNGNFWTYGSWIEGMGNSSLGGLLGSAFAQPTCDCAQNIICFQQNGVWAYHNPLYISANCVNDALAVTNIADTKTGVSVYPNPLTGAGIIHVEGLTSAGLLHIYSITGALLHSYPVNGKSDISISSSEYASGIYMYKLGSKMGKFVVR